MSIPSSPCNRCQQQCSQSCGTTSCRDQCTNQCSSVCPTVRLSDTTFKITSEYLQPGAPPAPSSPCSSCQQQCASQCFTPTCIQQCMPTCTHSCHTNSTLSFIFIFSKKVVFQMSAVRPALTPALHQRPHSRLSVSKHVL